MKTALEVIEQHRSVRKFLQKDIEQKVLQQILESGRWASTSHHLQAYSVITVRNKEKKHALAELCGNQVHVKECPVFLVFCADLNRIKLCHELEEKPYVLDTVEPFLVATVDAALYGQNVLLAAEALGLGGVFIGGIRNQSAKVCELLTIPDYVFPVFGMCLGYPDLAKINEQKPRLPLTAIVHEEQYVVENQVAQIEEYNQVMKNYYETRSTGNRSQTWSDYVSETHKGTRRAHLRGFLEEKKFGFN